MVKTLYIKTFNVNVHCVSCFTIRQQQLLHCVCPKGTPASKHTNMVTDNNDISNMA